MKIIKQRKILIPFSLIALIYCHAASAELGGLFWGATGGLADVEATYSKLVDNSDSQNQTSVAGRVFSDEGVGDANVYELGVLVGYRHLLDETFVSVQLELATTFGEVSGHVDGEGVSENRNRFGEAWPEDWTFGNESEIGLVAKWGKEFNIFNFLNVSGYVLSGFKSTDTSLKTEYLGCFRVLGCDDSELEAGSFEYDSRNTAYVIGAGVERAINNEIAIQIEYRTHITDEDEWNDEYEDGTVQVLPSLDRDRSSLTINVVRFF